MMGRSEGKSETSAGHNSQIITLVGQLVWPISLRSWLLSSVICSLYPSFEPPFGRVVSILALNLLKKGPLNTKMGDNLRKMPAKRYISLKKGAQIKSYLISHAHISAGFKI